MYLLLKFEIYEHYHFCMTGLCGEDKSTLVISHNKEGDKCSASGVTELCHSSR